MKGAKTIITIMNGASKTKLQAIGMNDRSTIMITTRRVIGKQNQMKNGQNKIEALLKKVNSFKERFDELFKMGLPSFCDGFGNLNY